MPKPKIEIVEEVVSVNDFTISRNSREDLLEYYSQNTPVRILDKVNELLALRCVPTHFPDSDKFCERYGQHEMMSNLVDTFVLKALDIAIRDIKIDIQGIENAELWIKLEEEN